MTYVTQEAAGAGPIELFRFYKGGTVLAYTSGDRSVTYNGDTYVPAVIARESIGLSDEDASNEMRVSLSRDLDAVAWFVGAPPEVPVWVTVYRVHRTDLTNAAELWYGEVADCALQDATAKMTCWRVEKALEQTIPRVLYQGQCNHMLYDARCTVNKASFQANGTVSGITVDGNGRQVLTVSGIVTTTDWYTGGFLYFGAKAGYIEKHSGLSLTMMVPVPSIAVGAAVSVFAGCNHLSTTCKNKFNNAVNFGGFEYVPTQNPFVEIV